MEDNELDLTKEGQLLLNDSTLLEKLKDTIEDPKPSSPAANQDPQNNSSSSPVSPNAAPPSPPKSPSTPITPKISTKKATLHYKKSLAKKLLHLLTTHKTVRLNSKINLQKKKLHRKLWEQRAITIFKRKRLGRMFRQWKSKFIIVYKW